MKFNKIAIATIFASIIFYSCNKTNTPTTLHGTKKYETGDPNFRPSSAQEADQLVRNFVKATKYADKQTRTTFPNVPVAEGAWLLEGGANFLENPNYHQFFVEEHTFYIQVDKVNSSTLDGQSLTNEFNNLMDEIRNYGTQFDLQSNLIDGTIHEQSETSATLKFRVTYGEPLPPGNYTYPANDLYSCDAATQLTIGISQVLQSGNVYCTGVVNHTTYLHPVGSGSPYEPYLWKRLNNSTFLSSEFTTYHTSGIALANLKSDEFYPQAPNTVRIEKPISVHIFCNMMAPSGSSLFFHVMDNIKTAGYLCSY